MVELVKTKRQMNLSNINMKQYFYIMGVHYFNSMKSF